MNMTEELERLSALRKEGSLTDEEFALAKERLLNQPDSSAPSEQHDSLGEAANRYVTFRIAMSMVGLVIMIIIVAVMLGSFRSCTDPNHQMFRSIENNARR